MVSTPGINSMSDFDALRHIGELVDKGGDTGNPDCANRALEFADELEARGVPPKLAAVLDYFRANAWEVRYLQRLSDRALVWDWEQPEVQQQVFLLRRVMNGPLFDDLHPMNRCQILTNLGNQLDKLGRFVEAQAMWSRALAIDPNFWMARANRGNGLMNYLREIYDSGHKFVLAAHAHRDLADAVDHIATFPDRGDIRLAVQFAKSRDQIASSFDVARFWAEHEPDRWGLGDAPGEAAYRRWCLDNVLFLNPLNDVEHTSIAARDILGLPNFRIGLSEPPIVIGMANELKQGFASARWLLYDGTHTDSVHFSDREVLLLNTLDYPAYGLSVEKVKLAFRMAYSTLDKIAFFLNHYLALGIPEKRVGFRTMWREKENGPIRDAFIQSENWPWRGLFWLSKDLFDERMRETIEPDARALADLRNHLEHKYVKVHEMGPPTAGPGDPFHDTLAYAIGRTDLERRTLKLLQLTRAALIYLFLGMHRMERGRETDEGGFVGLMPLDPLDDEWKR